MNDALKHPNIIDQATDCGYFLKESDKGRKLKSRAANSMIDSVLNVGSHKQQFLALNDALRHP